jgi:TRAP-type C4-dicarboxylate transport system substrate-binding protein
MRSLVGRGALHAAAAISVVFLGLPTIAAEPVLRVQTGLPRNHDLVQSFFRNFLEPVNEKSKGSVRLVYLGGPEITPARRAASALQRGVIDMLQSPSAYYAGQVPLAAGLIATNQTPDQLRANGGMAIMQRIWKERLNAHILAWPEFGAQYALYFARKPKLDKDGVPDLRGFKMRTTPAYRPILAALGASQVGIPAPEMYTALQRGLVDGLAWPNVALASMGITSQIKFRLDPPFYHLSNLTLVNLDKWNALPKAARDYLTHMGRRYEAESEKGIDKLKRQDAEKLGAAGTTTIELKGTAAKKYLKIALDSMWQRLEATMGKDELAEIRPKLYVE